MQAVAASTVLRFRGAPLLCSGCGSDDLISVRPGCDSVRAETGMLVRRGSPPRGWCAKCWPWSREDG